MAKSTVQIPVDETLRNKLVKAQKELKADSLADASRQLLVFSLDNDMGELRTKLERARIIAKLHRIEEVVKEKEHLEAQLEKLGA